MIVIIEGADGSGKTTLANRLRKDLKDYCIFIRSNGPPRNLQQLVDMITLLQEIPPRLPVITDRNPVISEYVYGPILRGKCMHGLKVEQMTRLFKDKLIIHCRPSYSALEQSVRREEQLEGVIDNHRHIVRAYDWLMGRLSQDGVKIKPYDYTGPPQLIMDTVKAFITEKKSG
ncbi:hypothetical protein [[Eubacterium] cellulosolvens]